MRPTGVPMTQAPDKLFRRYQKTRDPELLARVFDATAPQLLRVAIHLAGNAVEAEDLVQATFLAAIRRADTFAGEGSVQSWLSGILGNKAKDARRQGARDVDPERLVERAVTTPLEEAEQAEFSGELAKAIDDLDDTYRQAVILRLRHGMKSADIAHVLGLSPGAVRVRLSRGMEKLRRALPVGLASAAFLAATPERGLAAVREVVVAEAQAAAALVTGTSTLTVGGLLMTKKVLLGALALIVALVTATWLREPSNPRGKERKSAAPVEVTTLESEPELDVRAATNPPAKKGARVELDEPDPSAATFDGIVFDGETGAELAGVRVALYAPEELTLSQIKEREYSFVAQQNWGGEVRPFATWPHFETPLTEAQRLDLEPVRVWTRPGPGAAPVGRAVSNAAGRFELPQLELGGTVVCELEGYGRRMVPVTEAPEGELRIALREPRPLAGVVIDVEGERVEEELDLLFSGRMESMERDEDGEYIGQTKEAWRVRTAADGSFEVELPAHHVWPRVLTPGFVQAQVGQHPVHDQSWVFDTTLEPGGENACACQEIHDVYVVVQRVPYLHLTDAETGAGIEHFSMIGRELSNGYPRFSGRYYAPDGVYPLINEERWIQELGNDPFELVLWADGYAAWRQILPPIMEQDVIEIELARGSLPTLGGRVLDEDGPVENATVALQPYGTMQWSLNDARNAALVWTDADGGFLLSAPPGDYLLRVSASGREFADPVTLPDETERIVELSHLGRIVVTVADTDGIPQLDHNVVLVDSTGRSDWLFTDESGRVTFPDLAAGSYQIRAPKVATKGSFGGGIIEDVELHDGREELVAITIPARGEPRFARVEPDLDVDFDGWKACATLTDWADLEADGTIPIDLQQQNFRRLLIAAPDGRRWQANVPEGAPHGYEIRISLDGLRYEGVLLDLHTNAPVKHARVGGYPIGLDAGPASWPSTVTDEHGRFTLICTDEVPHRLEFHSSSEKLDWDTTRNHRFGFGFLLDDAPARDPVSVTVLVPRMSQNGDSPLETVRVRGRVLAGADGSGLAGTRIWITSLQAQESGTLEIWQGGTMQTDTAGRYELDLPDVTSYRCTIYGPDGKPLHTEEWQDASAERDVVVP